MGKRVIISNDSLNCYGTRVLTSGVDISQFERNPILLWMHWRGVAIGTIKDIRKEGDTITGEPVFDGIREESKLAKAQWDAETLKMVSANFDVIALSEDVNDIIPGQTCATVIKSKLVEVSIVDIGGNDDAMVRLSYNGNELKLGVGEALPLLNINNKQNEMDYKTIALKLGLPESATEQDLVGSITILLGYKTANETLKQENEKLQLAGLTQTVKQAVSDGKILADKTEQFLALGKKIGVESLKLTFDSMHAAVKPMNLLNGTSTGMQLSAVPGTWKKLSDVPEDKMEALRAEDRRTYMKLYKAEYGIDCIMQ